MDAAPDFEASLPHRLYGQMRAIGTIWFKLQLSR
jgi:hypothetical protein